MSAQCSFNLLQTCTKETFLFSVRLMNLYASVENWSSSFMLPYNNWLISTWYRWKRYFLFNGKHVLSWWRLLASVLQCVIPFFCFDEQKQCSWQSMNGFTSESLYSGKCIVTRTNYSQFIQKAEIYKSLLDLLWILCSCGWRYRPFPHQRNPFVNDLVVNSWKTFAKLPCFSFSRCLSLCLEVNL